MIKVQDLGGLGRFTVQLWGGSASRAAVLGRVLGRFWEQVLRTGFDTPSTTV